MKLIKNAMIAAVVAGGATLAPMDANAWWGWGPFSGWDGPWGGGPWGGYPYYGYPYYGVPYYGGYAPYGYGYPYGGYGYPYGGVYPYLTVPQSTTSNNTADTESK